MKVVRAPLQAAVLSFGTEGTPKSLHYGDVYHSRSGALEQARHVFLRGNHLPDRWVGQPAFTVCETGFGLGHNFLAVWQAWRHAPARPRRLHVVSFEAHPFTREDLGRALGHHEGEIRELAQKLLRAWPPLLPGLHRLEFEDAAVTLTLAFGKVGYLARQVNASVDAFFFDGFSPAVNPEMWSRELFGQMVRIAAEGATAATWCSAGQVRRDLAASGFIVRRVPGFAGKREMSVATLRPGLGRRLKPGNPAPALVVGGGLAGAGIAHSLALRGHDVQVLDPALACSLEGTHQGHRAAAMTPALSRDDNPMSRLSRTGIRLAHLRWKAMNDSSLRCGSLVRIDPAEAPAWQQFLRRWAIPQEWAVWCDPAEAARRTGLDPCGSGMWLEDGTLVRPGQLVADLLRGNGIQVKAQRTRGLRRGVQGWVAVGEQGEPLAEAPIVVLAAGAQTLRLLNGHRCEVSLAKLEKVQRIGGQVGYFRSGSLPATRAIVAGAGYWLPADSGVHTGGSTYQFDGEACEPNDAGFLEVAEKVSDLLGVETAALCSARATPSGWAGWRAALSDHLPVIGPVDAAESLWVACGYGSRGLSWMTLAGEWMAARLNAEPEPLERELQRAIRPR